MLQQVKRSKGSVRFAFKESNKAMKEDKKKESLIYLYFSFGKKRLKYSVGYKASFEQWDYKKQRIKNIRSYINKDKVNYDLAYFEKEILKRYYKLYDEHGENVQNIMIKNELDKIIRKKGIDSHLSKDKLTFIETCNQYLTDKGNNITSPTIRKYKQAIRLLKDYEGHYKLILDFDMINLSFFNSFKSFLEQKDYGISTIGKHIKSIKTFMNYATSEGYSNSTKYKTRGFNLGKQNSLAIYLSDSEIKLMHNMDLSKKPHLEKSRDVFLIGAYTGQRISDYNKLTKEDIVNVKGVNYFKFVQTKNRKHGREIMCPITKEIKEIMDLRYNGMPPPPLKDKQINEDIKVIGRMLGFNKLIKKEYTKGGKLIVKMIPKYQLIQSHTARRSFCTNMYLKGMPIFDIMLFSGHTSEREFYKYIRIKDEKRMEHILSLGYFNI